MATNVNLVKEKITYIVEDDCIPGNVVRDSRGRPVKNIDGTYQTSGVEMLDPGPQAAKNQGIFFSNQIPKSFLISQQNPEPLGGINRLNRLHVKAITTVLGKTLSGFSYAFINPNNYVGKYQLSPATLIDLGYLKQNYYEQYSSGAVKKEDAWTGKDGVSSLELWFGSGGVQEKAMYALLKKNYVELAANQGILPEDNLCTIAGMLCVAHILGPGLGTDSAPGARRWRATGGGTDLNGNQGTTFFSLGRYAIDVLAAKNI
jgi:hypothetical protein